MIQIRQSVFETNSSSSHSIVVQKKSNPVPPHDPVVHGGFATYRDGVVTIVEDNYFGWGWDILDTWLDRLAYALADLDELDREDLIDELAERHGITVVAAYRAAPWLEQGNGKEKDYGYIDHQSQGTLQEMLSEEAIKAIDFVFDDRYVVVLDNDNCDDDCYRAYIEKLDVEEEYPKYRWW